MKLEDAVRVNEGNYLISNYSGDSLTEGKEYLVESIKVIWPGSRVPGSYNCDFSYKSLRTSDMPQDCSFLIKSDEGNHNCFSFEKFELK